jgi:hypothetical protein
MRVASFTEKEPSVPTGQEFWCVQEPVLDKEVWREILPLVELNTILSITTCLTDSAILSHIFKIYYLNSGFYKINAGNEYTLPY